MQLQGNWNYPTSITVGEGCSAQVGSACLQAGINKALLVTDPGLADLQMVAATLDYCRQSGIECDIFSHIQSNPTDKNIEDGLQVYQQGRFNGVIAFGGGAKMQQKPLPLWQARRCRFGRSKILVIIGLRPMLQ